VIAEGVVVGEPDARDAYTNLRVESDKLIISDQPMRTAEGWVLIQAPPFSDFRYGDRICAEGKLQTPANTGDFDYGCSRKIIIPRCFRRIAESGGYGLDLAIQAEQVGTI
jgi:hypothetical protein